MSAMPAHRNNPLRMYSLRVICLRNLSMSRNKLVGIDTMNLTDRRFLMQENKYCLFIYLR